MIMGDILISNAMNTMLIVSIVCAIVVGLSCLLPGKTLRTETLGFRSLVALGVIFIAGTVLCSLSRVDHAAELCISIAKTTMALSILSTLYLLAKLRRTLRR